jgi:hypothetical protein
MCGSKTLRRALNWHESPPPRAASPGPTPPPPPPNDRIYCKYIHPSPPHLTSPHRTPPPRSIPTTSNDRIYCKILAHNAVHAAFAGYTGVTVGLVNTHYVYLPIPVIIQARACSGLGGSRATSAACSLWA